MAEWVWPKRLGLAVCTPLYRLLLRLELVLLRARKQLSIWRDQLEPLDGIREGS